MSGSAKYNSRKIMVNPLDKDKKIGNYEQIRIKANKVWGEGTFPGYDKHMIFRN